MRKFILSILLGATILNSNAQVQTIPTNSGDLQIQPVMHATFVMNYNGKSFYIDPTGGPSAFAGMAPPDVIIITDIHGDHCDPKTIDSIRTANTIIVCL